MKKVLILIFSIAMAFAAIGAYLWHTKYSTQARLETVIKTHLNDPASAVFGEFHQSKSDPNTWCGSVNSRNRMGGMVGFTSVVVTLDDQRDKYGLPYIEDEHVLAEVTFNSPDTVDKFISVSNRMCRPRY